jgi:hypothetical protein
MRVGAAQTAGLGPSHESSVEVIMRGDAIDIIKDKKGGTASRGNDLVFPINISAICQ